MIAPHRSKSQQARHARWAPAEAIRKAIGGRTFLRVGSVAAPDPRLDGSITPKISSASSNSLA